MREPQGVVLITPWDAGGMVRGSWRCARRGGDGVRGHVGVAAQLRSQADAKTGLDDFEIKEEWTNPEQWPEYKDLQMRLDASEAFGIRNPYFALNLASFRYD